MLGGYVELLQRILVRPRQPLLGVLFNGFAMTLQHDQILKHIDARLRGGGDEREQHIGNGRAGQGFKEQGIFAVADNQLQGLVGSAQSL